MRFFFTVNIISNLWNVLVLYRTENFEKISSCCFPKIFFETNKTNSWYLRNDPEIELDLDETTLQNISCAHSKYSPFHSDKQSIFNGNNFLHNFTENDNSYYYEENGTVPKL